MINDIKNVIDEIYIHNNKEIYISSCKKDIDFIDELINMIEKESMEVNVDTDFNEPAVEIRITVNKVSINGIMIEYGTILNVNKIVNYYYLQHEFSLENPDPDGMDSYLDSFREEAYNKKQFKLDEMIINYLGAKGYNRLSYADMEEVCPEIKKYQDEEDSSLMTVNNALFMDFWDICNSN